MPDISNVSNVSNVSHVCNVNVPMRLLQGDHKQRFFLGHSDLILCLAVHHTEDDQLLAMAPGASGQRRGSPSTIVCSGEVGAKPRVCVWCAETCEVCHDPRCMRCIHTRTSLSCTFWRTCRRSFDRLACVIAVIAVKACSSCALQIYVAIYIPGIVICSATQSKV